MSSDRQSFSELCSCLRGIVPDKADWPSLLHLANRTLTVTSLVDLTDIDRSRIPGDVSAYIRELHDRNVERNTRLAAQLSELLAALNAHGVTPILVKGAAMLATTPSARWGRQLMSDLDIVVAPSETDRSLGAMQSIGYAVDQQTACVAKKWFADLKRSHDVGMVDLHRELPGPAFFYQAVGDVRRSGSRVKVGEGSAYVPSTTCQAYILIIHDQFQDADYWLGDLDLRHLVQLRDLSRSPGGIDWDMLAAFAPGQLARNALESQLIALSSLLGVDVPERMRKRILPRLQFRRRMAQIAFPALRQLLLPLAILDFHNYHKGPRLAARAGNDPQDRNGLLPEKDRLRRLITWSLARRIGKL